jgi:hypothetical protein
MNAPKKFRNAAAFAVIVATNCIGSTASASVFEVTLEAIVSPQSPGVWLELPAQFNNQGINLQAKFLVDDQSVITLGNFNCEPGTFKSCGAYGYKVDGLKVLIDGVLQTGWRTGTNSKSFFNGPIDLNDHYFLTNQSLSGIANAWLPLLHENYPNASFNFGQMYISLGGVNFTSFSFSASDIHDQRANGWASGNATLASSVPEPTQIALAIAGLIALSLSSSNKFKRPCLVKLV